MLEEFLKTYQGKYPEEVLRFIAENFCVNEKVDIIAQVRSKLNLFETDKDIYQGFIEVLKKYDLVKGNMLEVGCGFYPVLAERLARENVDSITAVDPYLVKTSTGNIRLFKTSFPGKLDLQKYDSIIGLRPCEATIDIIETASRYNLPFSILLCGCTHFKQLNPFCPPSYARWEEYVLNIAYSTLDNGADIHVEELAENYNYPYKIITKTYKK